MVYIMGSFKYTMDAKIEHNQMFHFLEYGYPLGLLEQAALAIEALHVENFINSGAIDLVKHEYGDARPSIYDLRERLVKSRYDSAGNLSKGYVQRMQRMAFPVLPVLEMVLRGSLIDMYEG